jgi:hypothetical protein
MLLVSSVRTFFGSNKLVKTLLPIYKTKFESRLHKKSQSNLNANGSRSFTFSTISQQLDTIDANIALYTLHRKAVLLETYSFGSIGKCSEI